MKSTVPQHPLEHMPGRLRRRALAAFDQATAVKLPAAGIREHVATLALLRLIEPGHYVDLELNKRLLDFCRQSPAAAEQLAEQALTTRRANR